MKTYFITVVILILMPMIALTQTDYNNMNNWAFHPNKTGTLIDGFNIDIAVIDKNLNTTSIIHNTNNAMNNTGVDVFFIHPTILLNMVSYTTIETVPIANQKANLIAQSIRGQIGLLTKYGRLFAPRYQQVTPPTLLSSPLDSTQAAVIGVAYNDIKEAFLHYLNNYNNGNKIILASHSQGAILASMLLRDVFDNNPQLIEKLVVAVIAGIPSNYAPQNSVMGGWWQNIPFCTQQNECSCVMSWRSYKSGQIPPIPNSSFPAANPTFLTNNWVYNQLNLSQHWFYQDSLYYNDTYSPFRNLITLRSNVTFGPTSVGYVAFDSMYQIKYLRASPTQVGFVVEYTPPQDDLRPNILAEEESNPAFSTFGYHQKDYNIYTWALMEQIDLKLNLCGTATEITNEILSQNTSYLYPNPTTGVLNIKIFDYNNNFETTIYNLSGHRVHQSKNQNQIDLKNLPTGIYFIKVETDKSIFTNKLIKE